MRIVAVPGLYFKSYTRYTEARIPFETLALCGAIESIENVACRIVDFNLKGTDVHLGDGAAIFPGLSLSQNFYQEAACRIIKQEAPVCIFNISIHTNGNLYHSIKIAQAVRAGNPNSLIVFCGLGPSSRHTDLLDAYPHINAVVRGESEATLIELTRILAAISEQVPIDDAGWQKSALAALSDIEGITYRSGASIKVNPDRALIQNLDGLPMPSSRYYADIIRRASEQTKDLKYLSVEEHIHLEAGRGCPFSCTFCSNTYLWRRRYRLKSPERILAEITQYTEDFGAKKFLLHQQLFTVNKVKTRAFCTALIESNLEIEWSCFTRSDCVDDELLSLMKQSGCNTVLFGVESGSQKIQDAVRKKTKVDQVSEQISLVIRHGIKPQLSYIIGFPEESEDDLQQTIDMYFRYKFSDDVESQIGLLVPAGGTHVLTEYENDLDFDGVQTTTWYTRFFQEESYDEVASLPLVFPHNHFIKSTQVPRQLLLFVKIFDIAASYLNMSCRYVVLKNLLKMPFLAYREYQTWRAGLNDANRWASSWDGTLSWQTDVASIIIDFAQFLTEQVAAHCIEGELLSDLIRFELNKSMLDIRLHERNWDELCVSAPQGAQSDNFVADPDLPVHFNMSYSYAGLKSFVDNNFSAESRPTRVGEHSDTLSAAGNTELYLIEELPEGNRETRFPVFRQIEF